MTFLAPALLAGLAGLSIPVIIHLLFRRTAKVVDWGAMRFLLDSVVHRHRWMQMQEIILMFLRILVPVAAALAMARPFLPPSAGATTLAVGGLLAGAALCGAFFPVTRGRWRWLMGVLAGLGVAAAFLLFAIERKNLFSFLGGMGEGDWAIIVDASPSMSLAPEGEPLLDRALHEARQVIEKAPKSASFALIRGGPVPEALVLQPTKDRESLVRALGALQPASGEMDALKAMSLAALALAEGNHTRKGILVLTDRHRAGWNLEHPEEWKSVQDLFAKLPGGREEPPLVRLVALASPGYTRNLALNQPRLSRDRIGTDRAAQVLVDLENHGREAATARRVTLLVEGRPVAEMQPPTLNPGEVLPLKFSHKFPTNGFARVTVRLDADDDAPFDNTVELAVPVVPPLRALLVETRPRRTAAERATFFLEFALKPFTRGGVSPVAADRIAADDLLTSDALESYDAVVLTDVPRLPEPVRHRLSDFVRGGGGLLLAPGPKADVAFYNDWLASLSPTNATVRLGEWREAPDGQALRLAARAQSGGGPFDHLDWGEVQVFGAWSITAGGDASAGLPLLKFQHGQPMLSALFAGRGRVGLLALPLDAAFSNLPAHPVFLPLAHGLLDYLAGGVAIPVNLPPAWSHDDTWRNPSFSHNPLAGSGLIGAYEPSRPRRDSPPVRVVRRDTKIDFDWQDRAPVKGFSSDRFRVRWTGWLRGVAEGEHKIILHADERATLTLDGKIVIPQGREVMVPLSPARAVSVLLDYEEDQGGASCKLAWVPPGGQWQPVPTTAFTPAYPDPEPMEVRAVGDTGGEFVARWFPGVRQCRLVLPEAMQPGFYSLALPEDALSMLQGWLPAQAALRFSVQRTAEESHWSELSETDLGYLKTALGLAVTDSALRSFTDIEGQSKGRELWRILLYLLLAVAVTETLFAGLISWTRRPSAVPVLGRPR
jgi:hypothetical protein